MKRVVIAGIAVIALGVMLLAGVVLGVMVSPARAQIGQALGQVIHGARTIAVSGQAFQQGQTGPQLKAEKGVLVAGVYQGSPADTAGLARGDVILDVDGQAVNATADLRGLLAKHKVGDALKLTVQHGDTQKTVSLTLAAQPTAGQQNNNQNNGQNQGSGAQQATVPYMGIVPIGAGELNAKGDLDKNIQPGARIVQVAAGSPAEKAGLKVGETIVSVDGTQIDATNTLQSLLAKHKPGDSVKLQVTGTDGAQRDVTVTLGDNPQQQGTAYLGVSTARFGRGRHGWFGMPGMPGNGSGNGVPFNGQIPNLPNLRQHPGAYIEQVTSGSPAEKAGLKAGQLVVAVDGKNLAGPQDLTTAISGHKPGDNVTLSVYDPQTSKTSDIKVTLGDNPQKAGSAWLGIQYTYINMQNQNQQPAPGNNNNGTQF